MKHVIGMILMIWVAAYFQYRGIPQLEAAGWWSLAIIVVDGIFKELRKDWKG